MSLVATQSIRAAWACTRKFSLSCVRLDRDRESRMLNKMLSNNLDRKIRRTPSAHRVVEMLDKRRLNILNKMYMTNISEALCFGGFEELNDKGLHITRVCVRNSSVVDVFWTANESEDLVQIQNILSDNAGKVGNLLVNGNMGGRVPIIVFKRDLAAIHESEIQEMLHKLALRSGFETDLSSTPVDEVSQPLLNEGSEIPKMRMDTVGLPYDKILSRIKDAKRKSYPLEMPKAPTSEEFQKSFAINNQSTAYTIEKQHQRKKELKKFIALYQKSELSSSARKRNLFRKKEGTYFYSEEDAEDQTMGNFDELEQYEAVIEDERR